MKTFRLISIVFLLALLAAACGREASERMDVADSLMTERPDSALYILRSVTPEMRSGQAQEARYDMLLTDALYRCEADSLLSDSVIGVATDYYELRNDNLNAARALWLAGIVASKIGSQSMATVKFLRAEKYALRVTSDNMRLGLIYRSLGESFSEFYDIRTSLEYLKKAYHHFKKTDSSLHSGYAAAEAAARCLDLRAFDDLKTYSDLAAEIADSIGNDDLLVAARCVLARSYVRQGKYDEAIGIYEPLLSFDSFEFQEEDYMNLGLCYLMVGDRERAEECNRKVTSFEDGFNIIELNKNIIDGNLDNATGLMRATIEDLDSIRNSIWTRNDISTINDFYREEDNRMNSRLETERYHFWIVTFTLILLTVIAIAIFTYRRQLNRKILMKAVLDAETLRKAISNIENALSEKDKALKHRAEEMDSIRGMLHDKEREVENLTSDISRLDGEKIRLSDELTLRERRIKLLDRERKTTLAELHDALSKRFGTIDRLLDCYFQTGGTHTETKTLIKQIKLEVENFIDSKETLVEIMDSANSCLDGLIDRFREDFPELNDNYVSFFTLCALGFSNNAITILQQTTISTVYNRRSKLKNAIKNSGCENSKQYLRYL